MCAFPYREHVTLAAGFREGKEASEDFGNRSAAGAAGGQEGERAGSGALTLLGGGACERRACAQREAVAPAKTKGQTVAERARGG